MRQRSLLALAATAFCLFLFSCKNSKTGLQVPKDASIVLHINSSSLLSKLSWDEIKQTTWFKEMYGDANDSLLRQILNNPEAAGIDIKSDLVFFMKKHAPGGFVVFEGKVKDAAAFEAFNKKISNGASAVKSGDYSHLTLPNKTEATWSSSRFAYVIDAPYTNFAAQSFQGNTGNGNFIGVEGNSFSPDSLRKFGKEILSLKGKDNLDDDDRFADLVKDEGDMHLWMNSEKISDGLAMGMLSMMKLDVLLKGNVSATSLNFDNGKIAIKSKQFYGEELTKMLDKYEFKPISEELINRIPSQNVLGVLVANYPPEALKELLKVTGVDGMANGFLGKMNYSVDEFIRANKGDLLFAVTDLQMKEKVHTIPSYDGGQPTTYTSNEPNMNMLFAVSINDKEAFNKLIGITKSSMGVADSVPGVAYKLENNWFAVGNSSDYVSKFLSGNKTNKAFADKISGHPFGGYIDIQRILTSSQSSLKDSTTKTIMNASVQLWKDIVFVGGDYKKGMMSSEVQINLMDKNTNSLKQLNQYFDRLAVATKPRNDYSEVPPAVEDIQIDTTTVTAP